MEDWTDVATTLVPLAIAGLLALVERRRRRRTAERDADLRDYEPIEPGRRNPVDRLAERSHGKGLPDS